jgi:hypothetical protein
MGGQCVVIVRIRMVFLLQTKTETRLCADDLF